MSFPEAEEDLAHGSPRFGVRGKTFAMYVVNHHGDGRVALWLNSPPGAQDVHARGEPKNFFVPPYVGPRGWLGVELNKGLSWKRIAVLVREAYEKVAPPALRNAIGKTIEISPPKAKLTAEQINPMRGARGQRLLKVMRKICLALPETSECEQFGAPTWRAGKRAFASVYFIEKRLNAGFWVGVDRQGLLTADERFTIPAYIGHNGWISLDVHDGLNEGELRDLALDSYRHFANKRMLAEMGSAQTKMTKSKTKTKRDIMTIKRFETGPRMSQAVVHNGTVYVAGQVAKGATVKDQTTAIVKQIDSLLAAAGTDKSKLLSATIWLVNVSSFAEMNSVWDAWVSPGNTPARACVESKLVAADYLVEIAVICAV